MSPVNTSTLPKLQLIEQSGLTEDTRAFTAKHYSDNQTRVLRKVNQLLHWYIATDCLALFSGFILAWELAAKINSLYFSRAIGALLIKEGPVCLLEFMLIGAGVILWFMHTDHYRVRMPFWLEIKKIVSALGFAMMADGFLQFASKQDFSRLWLISCWAISAFLIVLMRNALRSHWRRQGIFCIPTLLVGSGKTASHTIDALNSEPGLGYEIAAHIQDLPLAFLQAGKSWKRLCKMHGAEYVIIALDGQEMAVAEQSLTQLVRESVSFSISPPIGHLPVMGMVPQYFFNHDIMLLTHSSGLEQALPCFIKRSLDIAVSALALLALSPVMLVIALFIKGDGGPALYSHSRVGRNGKVFGCLKFRSMVLNGDAVLARHLAENPMIRQEWQNNRKLQNDPRVTKLGNFLRRSSLDELPQLFNVLLGDMSLVGPRPIVTAEIANYDGDIMHYYRVRPGVTGLWQVSGRSDVSYPQRVHMDSWYVRNWSLWHDIAILCKTFPALLKRRGAY